MDTRRDDYIEIGKGIEQLRVVRILRKAIKARQGPGGACQNAQQYNADIMQALKAILAEELAGEGEKA